MMPVRGNNSNPPGLGWTLPASWYREPAHFEREKSAIFLREWLLFAWSGQLEGTGSYVAGTLAGYPVLVVRGADGVARGFHNVCRHRAAMLVGAGAGRCGPSIRCPYHNWTYDLDGLLKKATDFGDGQAELDAESWALHRIAVAEWRGLVFVRLAQDGPGIEAWLGDIVPMSAHYPLEQQRFFKAREREVAVDWKVYGENYLECYHCRAMHPGLCAAVDIDRYTINVYNDQKIFHLYAPKREGGLTEGLYFYRFPFLMLNLYEWGSSIATIEPVGAGRIRHVNWYFFTDTSAEREQHNHEAADWSAQIVTEDLAMVAGVQRNLETGIYERGVLSPRYEHAVLAFQDMCRAALGDDPGLRLAAE